MHRYVWLAAVAVLLGGCSTTPQVWTVDVVRVIDGDTIVIRFDNGIYDRVRLAGIDAPERGTPNYTAATEALTEMVDGQTVKMDLPERYQRGSFGRLLGRLWLSDGQCVNDMLLATKIIDPWTGFKRYRADGPERVIP